MKKVNLTKYGFVRWPEKDYSDDGNRFQCYRAGKAVEVSKLIADGQIYLSINAECGNGTLPFELYSRLPYYKEANWTYNGVSIEKLTEEDIQAFYDACIEYEKAYLEEEAHIEYPSLEDIRKQCNKIGSKRMEEINEIENILQKDKIIEVAMKFSEYEWKSLRDRLNHLSSEFMTIDPETYPEKIYGTSYSFSFVSTKNSALTHPNYWYSDIMEMFKKHGII